MDSADDDGRRYYGRGGYLGRYGGIGIGRFSRGYGGYGGGRLFGDQIFSWPYEHIKLQYLHVVGFTLEFEND